MTAVLYGYDGLGRLTSVRQGSGTTAYKYDLMGRVTQEKRSDSVMALQYTADYQYSADGVKDYQLSTWDAAANAMAMVYRNTYNYDPLSRMSQMNHTQAGGYPVNVGYEYTPQDNISKKTVKTQLIAGQTDFQYNAAGLMNSIQHSSGLANSSSKKVDFWERYSYDLSGNLREKYDPSGDATTYQYDNIGRLVREDAQQGPMDPFTDQYSYDDFGNRTRKVSTKDSGITTVDYAYDKAGKLLTQTKAGADPAQYGYSYDNGGNLLTKTKTVEGETQTQATYSYDAQNRMNKAVADGVTSTYQYDASGRRIAKTVDGVQTRQFWNGDALVYEQYADNKTQSYVHGKGLEATYDETNKPFEYMTDRHGDVRMLMPLMQITTNREQYQFDAYGNQQTEEQAVRNPLRYNGQYLDSETGNYYLRARYYDPSIGRFTQEDTYHGDAKTPQTLNLYNYCGSNPVTYTDPSGHFWETVVDIGFLAWSAYDFYKNPSWGTGLMLAWDIAATALPFIPGSYVGRAAKVAVKGAAKAVSALNKGSKIAKGAKTAAQTAKAAAKAAKAAEKAREAARVAQKLEMQRQAAAAAKRAAELRRAKTVSTTAKLKQSLDAAAAAKGNQTVNIAEAGEKIGASNGGYSKTNSLQNIQYTEKVKMQMKQGDYHSFPKSVEAFWENGKSSAIIGGDKITRTKIEIIGSYNGKDGIFEYIIEPDGRTVNHRLFRPNK